MLQNLKKIIKANSLLRVLIIPLIDRRIQFSVHKLFNKSFHVKLLNGSTIKLYPKGQIASAIFKKYFEKREMEMFQRIIKPGMVIVDAGANIGLYSVIAGQVVGSTGKVISFEPSKETFNLFLDNIELNGLSNIKPFNNGLGDKTNYKLILRQDFGCKDADRYFLPNNDVPDVNPESTDSIQVTEEVDIDTLDNCLGNLNIESVDFMKIDTEGFEYFILKGAKQILKNSPEIVILLECTELGTARVNLNQKDVFSLLEEVGLTVFYWNKSLCEWCDDELGAMKAGDVWVCKSKAQLLKHA